MIGSIASSLGIGTGIDTRALVSDLAANARKHREAEIASRETGNAARISVVASMKSGLESLASDYADSAANVAPADLRKLAASFVSGFNLLRTALTDSTRAGSVTAAAGALAGDAAARSLDQAFARLPQTVLAQSGTYRTLSDIGIGVTRAGTLQLDTARFNAAFAAAPDDVSALLASGMALPKALRDLSVSMSLSTGALGSATLRYERLGQAIARDRARMEDDNNRLIERLTKSFGGMDKQVAQLNAVKAYIEQQVAAWNSK